MCNGLSPEQLFRHSTRTFKGRVFNQDGSNQDVMIQWQFGAASLAEQASSSFVSWLDGMSQLQHPHVLPMVGACADPPATVAPFMPVCKLPLASVCCPACSPDCDHHTKCTLGRFFAGIQLYLASHFEAGSAAWKTCTCYNA